MTTHKNTFLPTRVTGPMDEPAFRRLVDRNFILMSQAFNSIVPGGSARRSGSNSLSFSGTVGTLPKFGPTANRLEDSIVTESAGVITVGGEAIVTGLTASRLLSSDASKQLASVADLTSWIAGTTNQITVSDDGDGTATLSLPQNIHTGASPTFTGLTLSGLTEGQVVFPGSGGVLSGDAGLFWNNSTKRLGIGTASPGALLHLRGTTPELRIEMDNTETSGRISFFADVEGEHARITSNGSTLFVDTADVGAAITFRSDNFVTSLSLSGAAGSVKADLRGPLFITERAAALADTAGQGQLWVKSDTPNNIYFTDDAGNDRQLVYAGGAFHDGFSDFVANEHIDHTAVTLTAGTGLTGGGDISASRSFAVDGVLEDLDTLGAAASDGQFIVATGAGAFAYESGATLRTSIGVGTGASPTFTGLTLSGLTEGQVVFPGSGGVLSGDAGLFWNNSTKRLGIGTASPGALLEVDDNILINGISAGKGNNSVTRNTGFGENVLSSITTGPNNTGFGYNALAAATEADDNSAFGMWTLQSLTTGIDNAAFGNQSQTNVTTATGNSSFGWRSLRNLTTGGLNVAGGRLALSELVATGSNVGLGDEAGRYLGDGSTPATSMTNGIYLGANTHPKAADSDKEIVIGKSVTGLGNNTIALGDSDNEKFQVYGSVGLGGMPDPIAYRLYVGGSFTSSGGASVCAGSNFATHITAVNGDTAWQSQMVAGQGSGGSITTQGNGETINVISTLRLNEPNITVGAGDTVTNAATLFILGPPTEATNNYSLWVDNGVSRFDGNVGIGTDSPGALLDVNGASIFQGLSTWDLGTTPSNAILLDMAEPTSGTEARDSHSVIFRGTAFQGSGETHEWKLFNDMSTGEGIGSVFKIQYKTDGGAFSDTIVFSGSNVAFPIPLNADQQVTIAGSYSPTTSFGLNVRPVITATGGSTVMSHARMAVTASALNTEDNSVTYSHIETLWLKEPNITKGASDTITSAATLYIEDAPTEGTNNYALLVDSGDSRFDGAVLIPNIKSGATQGGAGAAANELWKTASHATLPDNVVMIGV